VDRVLAWDDHLVKCGIGFALVYERFGSEVSRLDRLDHFHRSGYA
jgi:hypothetical protein